MIEHIEGPETRLVSLGSKVLTDRQPGSLARAMEDEGVCGCRQCGAVVVPALIGRASICGCLPSSWYHLVPHFCAWHLFSGMGEVGWWAVHFFDWVWIGHKVFELPNDDFIAR